MPTYQSVPLQIHNSVRNNKMASQLSERLSAALAPVSLMPVGALVCPRGSVLDIVYNEYRDSLDRLLMHIRSYDERVHGALQVSHQEEYEEHWRVYQTIAIQYASAAEESPEDADYAGELALRNAEISKKRDLIVLYAASLDKDSRALAHPDEWFDHLDYLIAAAQKEWDEMVEMRRVYPEDE